MRIFKVQWELLTRSFFDVCDSFAQGAHENSVADVGVHRGQDFCRAMTVARDAIKRMNRCNLNGYGNISVVVDQLGQMLRKVGFVQEELLLSRRLGLGVG
jgi:hypothetical protein